MTLLNGLLALGALAFTIPLTIHLLFRSRFKTVQWGAMHLLNAVVRTNQRRLQITELLLLLVRCAIPVLLALALARPVLTGFRSLPGESAQTVVVAIDDSRSMNATNQAGQTAMQRCADGMTDYLSRLSRRDEVMLITSSQAAKPVATMGRDEAIRRLREIKPSGNAANLSMLLRSAATALSDAANPQRRVVLVSDLRSSDVTDDVLRSFEPIERVFAAMEPAASVKVFDVGDPDELTNNLFVEAIIADSQVAVKDRTLRLSARVRNDTERFGNNVGVTWWIDDQQVESQRISVQPRSATLTRLSHKFESSGVHSIRVTIEWPDALLADNQRQLAIDVIDGVEVLLVDGQPGKQPLEGETDFLAISLSPFGLGGSKLPDAVRSRTISADRGDPTANIEKELAKTPVKVIVLANVPEPSEKLRNFLANYVDRGGSLVVFDGDQIKPEAYNASWKATSKDGEVVYLLPAELGSVLGNAKQREAERIVKAKLNQQFAPWSSVLPRSGSALDEVDVYAYRQVTIREEAREEAREDERDDSTNSEEEPGNATVDRMVLMQTSTGQPLAVSSAWGRGRVVQFAIPADGDWTSLPLRMVFLPLMQQLVIDLAGNGNTPNVVVGQTIRVPVSELAVATGAEGVVSKDKPNATPKVSQLSYTVQAPAQKEDEIDASQVAGLSDTPRLVCETDFGAGVYSFRQLAKDTTGATNITSTLRVAEIDPAESQLRPAGAARTAAFAESLGATLHADANSLVNDDQVDRFGREVWRWLLALLLFALVAELFLQQRRLVVPSITGNQARTFVS